MEKRRIREDFKYVWGISWNGVPEDFSDTLEMVLTASIYGKRVELERDVDYVVDGNLLKIDFTPKICTVSGIYNLELNYVKPSDGFIDGERRSAVDIDAFQIVPKSAQITATGGITGTSDAIIGFYGLSAYEVWLKDNPESTKEDYYNWLRQPATDIEETVNLQEQARVEVESLRATAESSRELAESLRVEAELLRQSNTQEAISSAENATENANTAAQNANDAREAIQDDLALKANHGYESNPKTLKEVDDNASVKIENLVVNGDFRNGIDGWIHFSNYSIETIVSDNLRSTTTNNRPYFGRSITKIRLNDKIYYSLYIRGSKDGSASLEFGNTFPNSEGGRAVLSSITTIFNKKTNIHTVTSDLTAYFKISGGGYNTSGDYIEIRGGSDGIKIINLTTTFGAGNEPTIEEFELLLATLGTDYFEGEITIPVQKIMQWQLALIRKNKNAIIALGGTII